MINFVLPLFIFFSPTPEFPDIDLHKENVYKMCVEYGIKHPEIVTAQSILETGNYACDSCSLNKNNIFGWYVCLKRDSLGKCISAGYKYFTHWTVSTYYYKWWQDRHYADVAVARLQNPSLQRHLHA